MESDMRITPLDIVKKARTSIASIRGEAAGDIKILQKVAWTEKYIDVVSKSDLIKRKVTGQFTRVLYDGKK